MMALYVLQIMHIHSDVVQSTFHLFFCTNAIYFITPSLQFCFADLVDIIN